jgi:hypothetical protein
MGIIALSQTALAAEWQMDALDDETEFSAAVEDSICIVRVHTKMTDEGVFATFTYMVDAPQPSQAYSYAVTRFTETGWTIEESREFDEHAPFTACAEAIDELVDDNRFNALVPPHKLRHYLSFGKVMEDSFKNVLAVDAMSRIGTRS